MVGNNFGANGVALRERKLQPEHLIPLVLPLQASEVPIHNKDLPPQRESARLHLPGHPLEPVVAGPNHRQSADVNPIAAHGPESRRSPGGRHRQDIQERQSEI